jgi:hypothetical protein
VSTLRGSYGKCKRPGLDQGAPSGPRFFHSVGNSFGSFAGVVLPACRARFLRYGYGLTWLKIMVEKNPNTSMSDLQFQYIRKAYPEIPGALL